MLSDVLSVTALTNSSMCIYHLLHFSQMNFNLTDSETFIETLMFPLLSLLSYITNTTQEMCIVHLHLIVVVI